jgi:hypothetical protein
MNPRKTIIAILATLSASLALAEDFKTVNGKEYKNATITRVEPDGITVKFSGGRAGSMSKSKNQNGTGDYKDRGLRFYQ